MQRKSYLLSKAGSLNNLNLMTEELGKPKDNEVTIEVKAIGLNFADVFTIYGLYKAAPKSNFIPGLEFSGIVIDKGKNALNIDINDKVMGVVKFGSFTTHLNIDYRYIIRQLGDWSFEEGASFIVQASTAYYALVKLGNIVPNQTTEINVQLVFSTVNLKEVEVTAQLEGQSAAINQQLSSNTIVNVVSQDKIQELPHSQAVHKGS
ncbi:MAG: alcohol dehydrogenase catalytic domain-containing protein [Ignavibacteriaceae bacterium]